MDINLSRTATTCAKCSREFEEDSIIHLWDGNDYCRGCVSAASPKLLELAERFSAFSEHITVNPRDAVRDEFYVWCILAPACTSFFCFCAVQNGLSIWSGLFVGILVIVPATLLRAFGTYRNAKAVSGDIAVENGYLRIWHPGYGKAAWALRDCRWHMGKSREAKSFFPRLHLRRKMVIVLCPLGIRFLWPLYEKVPCGLTDETRDVWKAFFSITENALSEKTAVACHGPLRPVDADRDSTESDMANLRDRI